MLYALLEKKDLCKGIFQIFHWIFHFMYLIKASNCKFRVPAGFDVGLRASSGFWILVIFGAATLSVQWVIEFNPRTICMMEFSPKKHEHDGIESKRRHIWWNTVQIMMDTSPRNFSMMDYNPIFKVSWRGSNIPSQIFARNKFDTSQRLL